jgi:glycosyltransferase involved in cell wall biosynthesis
MTHDKPGYAFLLPWSPDQGGGVTHVAVALLKECAAEDVYRPVLLELNWASLRPRGDEWRGIRRIRFRLRPLWVDRRLSALISFLTFLPWELYCLRRLIRDNDLRVINMHFPGPQAFVFVALRRLGLFVGKLILSFHGSDVRRILQTHGVERYFWSLVLSNSDLLVFVSEDLKQEFLALDPTLANRSVVVHNGVDFETFSTSPQDASLPDYFSKTHKILLSVGQFEYRKGHDLLLEAFLLVLRKCDRVRLAIVGRSGPTLGGIRSLIAERHLEDHVAIFTDLAHHRLPALLNRADVFVLSSRWRKGEFGEGFPLVLAEAGAAARPVVSTHATGCGEIIVNGVTGRLVPLEDSTALGDAIASMLNDPDSARGMGLNLQNLVRRKFSWRGAWVNYRERIESLPAL